jgi:hypothetical protein
LSVSSAQLDERGAGFFLQAFLGPTAKLCWPDVEEACAARRAGLFTAVYQPFESPRTPEAD